MYSNIFSAQEQPYVAEKRAVLRILLQPSSNSVILLLSDSLEKFFIVWTTGSEDVA